LWILERGKQSEVHLHLFGLILLWCSAGSPYFFKWKAQPLQGSGPLLPPPTLASLTILVRLLCIYLFTYLFTSLGGTEFELKASHLLGRYSTTCAMLPDFFIY
jgi:hypothetical protein